MDDLISRQAVIDALAEEWYHDVEDYRTAVRVVGNLPSAQPERRFDEWCKDCKEYDHERHCCPRWNRVIRTTLQEVQGERKKGKWVRHGIGHENVPWGFDCSACGEWFVIGDDTAERYNFCPNCGAEMKGEEDG